MDYETKPTSRETLRRLAPYFRKLFDAEGEGQFPVLDALERVGDVFKGTYYEVVHDNMLEPTVMAQCTPNEDRGFTIEIKESVYQGAYNGDGACRGFICHEMCHIFLFAIGFTPIYTRGFANNIIPPYKSVEWQAKALCGEIMIPYEESKGMSEKELIKKYVVSQSFARKRREHEK